MDWLKSGLTPGALFQRCLVHVTFNPRLDPDMVRLEGVRMMEREAEAERKRLELASPQDKPQEQPAGQVSLSLVRENWFSLVLIVRLKNSVPL